MSETVATPVLLPRFGSQNSVAVAPQGAGDETALLTCPQLGRIAVSRRSPVRLKLPPERGNQHPVQPVAAGRKIL